MINRTPVFENDNIANLTQHLKAQIRKRDEINVVQTTEGSRSSLENQIVSGRNNSLRVSNGKQRKAQQAK